MQLYIVWVYLLVLAVFGVVKINFQSQTYIDMKNTVNASYSFVFFITIVKIITCSFRQQWNTHIKRPCTKDNINTKIVLTVNCMISEHKPIQLI